MNDSQLALRLPSSKLDGTMKILGRHGALVDRHNHPTARLRHSRTSLDQPGKPTLSGPITLRSVRKGGSAITISKRSPLTPIPVQNLERIFR